MIRNITFTKTTSGDGCEESKRSNQGITICGRRPENFEWKQFYINKDDLKQEVKKRMS